MLLAQNTAILLTLWFAGTLALFGYAIYSAFAGKLVSDSEAEAK
jgi:preprotein translocase subunit SecG